MNEKYVYSIEGKLKRCKVKFLFTFIINVVTTNRDKRQAKYKMRKKAMWLSLSFGSLCNDDGNGYENVT